MNNLQVEGGFVRNVLVLVLISFNSNTSCYILKSHENNDEVLNSVYPPSTKEQMKTVINEGTQIISTGTEINTSLLPNYFETSTETTHSISLKENETTTSTYQSTKSTEKEYKIESERDLQLSQTTLNRNEFENSSEGNSQMSNTIHSTSREATSYIEYSTSKSTNEINSEIPNKKHNTQNGITIMEAGTESSITISKKKEITSITFSDDEISFTKSTQGTSPEYKKGILKLRTLENIIHEKNFDVTSKPNFYYTSILPSELKTTINEGYEQESSENSQPTLEKHSKDETSFPTEFTRITYPGTSIITYSTSKTTDEANSEIVSNIHSTEYGRDINICANKSSEKQISNKIGTTSATSSDDEFSCFPKAVQETTSQGTKTISKLTTLNLEVQPKKNSHYASTLPSEFKTTEYETTIQIEYIQKSSPMETSTISSDDETSSMKYFGYTSLFSSELPRGTFEFTSVKYTNGEKTETSTKEYSTEHVIFSPEPDDVNEPGQSTTEFPVMINSSTVYEDGVTFTTELNYEVPSQVDFNITNITTNSFTIQWIKPSSFSGSSRKYYISIEDKGPKHKIWEPAPPQSESLSKDLEDSEENLFYTFDRASPNCLYNIQILAGNDLGNSTGEIQTVITYSSHSTEPLNIESETEVFSNHCNGTEYNCTLHIRWELPLNTNGYLEYFEIEIRGSTYSDMFMVNSTEAYDRNLSFHLDVPNLNASSSYEYTITPISIEYIRGSIGNASTRTPGGCPSKPTGLVINKITSSGFDIKWTKSEEFYGKISNYEIEIKMLGYNHSISKDIMCDHITNPEHIFRSTYAFYKFQKGKPDYNYKIAVRAHTFNQSSPYSEFIKVTTKSTGSMPVRDVSVITLGHNITEKIYEYYVKLSFKEPCNTNGPFVSYLVKCIGYRNGYPDDNCSYNESDISRTSSKISLKNAEYTYSFEVIVITEINNGIASMKKNITTLAGVPPANTTGKNYLVNDNNPTIIETFLNKNIFSNTNGNIMYYAIIIMKTNRQIKPNELHYGEWNGSWPSAVETVRYGNEDHIFQLTVNFWNPFNDSTDQISFSIGETSDCQINYCHNLLEDTHYIIVTRGLTNNTYIDINTLIKTGKSSNLWLILTLTFLCLLLFVTTIYLYAKKGQSIRIKFKRISNGTTSEEVPRHVIPVKHFSSYYNKIKDDPQILRQQYTDIEDEIRIYKEKHVKSDFALKPENKRKNRYINILPYDENRIRLNIDEDDEISSDYINASYIKGFTGEIEYIASQGPLEHTSKDFWKMVIQENVSIIVMVSHFVENEKEKCFKYFPKNYENTLICEDLEVKCLTELQFDSYCVRTLLVRKDIKQYTVVHLQYLDWPDFGCPSGTSNMLFFCQEVRDRIKLERGLMVVHCSAGVGRTGTLISLDILLQAVKKKKEISIFETVMQLRKQRTHMVQTEKQYIYLHTCIKDALENEAIYLREDVGKCDEHTYKNTSFHESYLKEVSETKQHESAC